VLPGTNVEQKSDWRMKRGTHGRNEDKQRFKNLNILSKQIQSKVNENEILR